MAVMSLLVASPAATGACCFFGTSVSCAAGASARGVVILRRGSSRPMDLFSSFASKPLAEPARKRRSPATAFWRATISSAIRRKARCHSGGAYTAIVNLHEVRPRQRSDVGELASSCELLTRPFCCPLVAIVLTAACQFSLEQFVFLTAALPSVRNI